MQNEKLTFIVNWLLFLGNWSPSVCIEGPHQSPIGLSTSLAEEADFPPFRMDGYWQNMSTILQNNGHSGKDFLWYKLIILII